MPRRLLQAFVGDAATRPGLYLLRRPGTQAVLALPGNDPYRFRPPGGASSPEFRSVLAVWTAEHYHRSMTLNKIDEAVLVLLYLGIHQCHRTTPGVRTWKSHDWDAMDRLHVKGLISDPATKAKSVILTEDGLREAEAAFRRLFDAEG